MKHILILFFISSFFIGSSHAQYYSMSSEKNKNPTHEKLKSFQEMVKNSRQNHHYLVEQGMKTQPPKQKAAVAQPAEQSSEQAYLYLYVELWTPKESWLNLSKKERQEYFDNVGGEIQKLTNEGIKVLGFAVNDQETPYRSEHQYIAIWQMPSKKHVEMLEESVLQTGWHEYFDQVNARGELMPPPAALEDMIGLK